MAPRATLDRRYSNESAEAIDWRLAERRLERAEVAWLVTVRRDGRPHATPVVTVQLNGTVYFHTSEPEQKYLNLQSNQNVLVLVGDSSWSEGLDVVVDGVAHPVDDEATLQVVADLYSRRWDGRWQLQARDGGFANGDRDVRSRVFEVIPGKAFAHSKGDPFGQTTYRF